MAKILKMIFYFIFFSVLNLCWGSEKSRLDSSDFNLTAIQIIRKYGYPVEVHNVVTEDGYILELHRIPHGRNSTSTNSIPILLSHGLIAASSQFLMLKSESLAFILSNEGYDVWMINFRGSRYSKKHVTLSPDNRKFWDFSWHEHGVYDIPASIDYILYHTGRRQLLYIGFSMGTTSFFVMSSVRPEYQKKLRGAVLLGPTAYMEHARTPLRHAVSFLKNLKGGIELIDHDQIFEHATGHVSEKGCEGHIVCRALVLFLTSDSTKLDNTILPVVIGHMPASTSIKNMAHFGQLIASGKFQHYDYGIIRNLVKYRQRQPPEYRLQAITLPLSLLLSPNDYFNSLDDHYRTIRQLPNVKNMYIVPQHSFTHLDFVVARNAKELVYDKVIEQAHYLINHGHE